MPVCSKQLFWGVQRWLNTLQTMSSDCSSKEAPLARGRHAHWQLTSSRRYRPVQGGEGSRAPRRLRFVFQLKLKIKEGAHNKD